MGILKNGKHELFAQKWHETDNKTEAYRCAYPRSLKWKPETVNSRASTLSKSDKVLERYKELQEETRKSHGVTIESLLAELKENRDIALGAETPQVGAANAATMGKAKLVGLDVVKVEHEVNSINANYDIKSIDPKQAAQEYMELIKRV